MFGGGKSGGGGEGGGTVGGGGVGGGGDGGGGEGGVAGVTLASLAAFDMGVLTPLYFALDEAVSVR